METAARHGLPVASGQGDFAQYGGVMQYSGVLGETPHLTGIYVAKILKGQNPAEMPIQHSTRTRLVVNLRAARTLGLVFPISLLARADEIIQ